MASILINGSPTSEFQFHCGLKQRDPLAPYLFILIMESLHLSFYRAVNAGIFTCIKIDSSLTISHLFYADDVMFIGEWSNANLTGVMVGGNSSTIKAWDDTIGKLKARLSNWKLKTLSIRGRLALLKSVLGSTPIYNMSLYKVPKSMLHLMESIRRNFFNGIQGDERKITWVKWSKVLASKKYGGLGVSSYYAFNRVLLFKWAWRFISQDNSLWCRFITSMHGSQLLKLSPCHSSTWNTIIWEINVLKSQGVDLISHCKIRVGNGICCSFSSAWVWDLNGEGVFRVKDLRNLLDEYFLQKDSTATRWVKSIPIKINMFAWKVYLDRLPTRLNLIRRGVQVHSLSCLVCNAAYEDMSHLLFSCDLANDVVWLVCHWWNLTWSPFGSYSKWLSWFNSIRSKEDDVSRISMSIFVTNFPDSFSAKDLFHSCKQYAHVVDTFIPSKRSKAGKRFGFVRFINVFNVERLVNNLCTIWVDRFKFHANIARFHRAHLNGNKFQEKKDVGINRSGTNVLSKDVGVTGTYKSYVHVVKDNNMSGTMECDSIPAIVLDDECLYSKDLYKSLLGRMKEFASLSNIKTDLMNEGWFNIKIQYMGELWVLLEFPSTKSKELFHENVRVGSWFSVLRQASIDFTPEGRIVWVEIEGIPFKLWSGNTLKWIVAKWGELLDVDDQKEMCFHSKRLCLYTKSGMNIFENFKVIFRGKVIWIRAKEVPGWVLDFLDDSDDEDQSDDGFKDGDPKVRDMGSCGDDSDVAEVPKTLFEESTGRKRSNSDSVGNSGGILCVWDPNSFHRSNTTILDYFIMIRGVWLKTGVNNLIVAVYAPYDLRDKRMLWDYLAHVINQWDGDVVTMGDFNEEVSLGGSSFTWCHKSATKMSKLDRFLISENLLITCPNISATTLDRYLSDHCPILLRETQSDYGPIPFRFFHHWTELEGFNKFVIDTWSEAPGDDSNAMMKELEALDAAIDKGNGSDEIVNKRMEVINSMHHIDKIQAIDMAQKAKIKWSIERDENSRFDKPTVSRAYVNMSYPKSITIDQQMDLERDVSKEELKRAVWDCGTDKSPGPDGFTFGFYRHFWSTIENDVFEAVKHFFTYGDIPKGCNSSFISLILKIPNANLVKDFRPISLIGSIYKIIAKIMANRLVGVLRDIVNECKLKKKQSSIFKVDLEKAYDSVRWDFLDDILKKFGFGNKCNALVHVLECFYRVSGLRINKSKSKIMGVHVEDEKVKYATSKLGCLILNTPLSYLGTKVGGSMSRVQAWKEVVDKVKSRLSNWKMKALSIAGRLTLLKSSLLYGHELRSNKATWVKWNSVLAFKEKGGLGVLSLYALNRGLMLKWVWRFYSHKTSLRARVIKAIYGVNVFDFMRLKLGNGDTTSFWEDNWIGGNVLKDLYLRIYALETCKSAIVSKKLTDSSLDNSFRRKTRGGVEQVQYNALSDLVHAVTLVPLSDKWVWSLESLGEFSVASVRNVNVLAWKIKIDALPTRLNISRRGIDIDSILCPICDCGVESSSHLFFSCSLARQVAQKISLWWDVTYVDVNSYVEWVTWMMSLRLTSKLKLMLEERMAGNDWINSYLEAILDVGPTLVDEPKSSLLLRERGRFSPTRYFVDNVIGFDETDLHRSWVKAQATRSPQERNTRLENMISMKIVVF
nr:RNA-directed DNA polymerase, eukaryota, reverse transcriptase zinc-binding domain protein [Tanacetum cinerariifolium]